MHEFADYIASMGLPLWLGYASAFTEFVGGILLITGTFTRIAAFFVFLNMCVAIAKVHWQHGLLGAGGYEFALALCTMAFALIFYGGGPISIDAIREGGEAGAAPRRNNCAFKSTRSGFLLGHTAAQDSLGWQPVYPVSTPPVPSSRGKDRWLAAGWRLRVRVGRRRSNPWRPRDARAHRVDRTFGRRCGLRSWRRSPN